MYEISQTPSSDDDVDDINLWNLSIGSYSRRPSPQKNNCIQLDGMHGDENRVLNVFPFIKLNYNT